MIRFFALLPVLFALNACSVFSGEEEAPPLEGERISVLQYQQDLIPFAPSEEVDIAITLASPAPSWAQAGRNAQNFMGNIESAALSQLQEIWKSDIGKGGSDRLPLIAKPIIADGKVFTLDTKSHIRAFHDQTGKLIWEKNIRPKNEDESVIAGGLAFDQNIIFVNGGYNETLALNGKTGEIIWRAQMDAGSRAAPTVYNGRVFVKTLNNRIVALNVTDGTVLWKYEGAGEGTGLLGTASPAVDDQIVVAAFSSGDVAALRVENGSVVWSDRLINNLQLNSLSTLADIRAHPVIEDNIIYAVSYGGKMVAIDKRSGVRKWAKDISSSETPVIIDDYIFVFNSDNKLIALDKSTGNSLWVTDVPRYAKPEKRKDPIFWSGPIMVNSQLILTGTNGIMAIYNAKNGELTRQLATKKDVTLAPVIANGVIYLLSEDGSLIAYR